MKKGIECNLGLDELIFNKCDVYEERILRLIIFKSITNESEFLLWEGTFEEISKLTKVSIEKIRKTVIPNLLKNNLIYRDKVNHRTPYTYIPLIEDEYSIAAINQLNNMKEDWKNGKRTTKWSNNVKKRDRKCAKCHSRNNLEAHHIFNFADFKIFANEEENGVALCEECHKKFHSIFGNKDNNKQQLIEFLLHY